MGAQQQRRLRRPRRVFVPLAVAALLTISLGGGAAPGPMAQDTASAPSVRPDCPAPVRVEMEGPGAALVWWVEPGLEALSRRLAEQEATFAPLPGGVDRTGWPGARLYVLSDLTCLEVLGLPTVRADWVAGVAHGPTRFAALRVGDERLPVSALRSTLRHELAHLGLYAATAGAAPRWLQEGYAQLAEGTWDFDQAWRIQWALARGESGPVLERLAAGFPSDAEGARLGYLLSFTVVREIQDMAGGDGLAPFLRALAETGSTEDAFRLVFGISESTFEDRWRDSVQSRYGVLYLLTRAGLFWIFLTGLLIWGVRRRRRMRRERQAELEARWARSEDRDWRADPAWRRPPWLPPLPPPPDPGSSRVDGPRRPG